MSDKRWTHAAYPSAVGAFGAALSALIGGVIVGGCIWLAVVLAGVGRELVIGYLIFLYLMESALATYRKWQRDP